MSTLEESAERLPEDKDLAPDRTRRKPPPGPPVYVQDFGYTIGIEKKRRKAREEWKRQYGDDYEKTRKAR